MVLCLHVLSWAYSVWWREQRVAPFILLFLYGNVLTHGSFPHEEMETKGGLLT